MVSCQFTLMRERFISVPPDSKTFPHLRYDLMEAVNGFHAWF